MSLRKQVIIIIGLMCLAFFLSTTNVHAVLQANGVANSTKNIGDWIKAVRYMESLGGTLGLNDTINDTDLTSTSDTSNNLDVHMQKNTEYGAMAILSASAYGNPIKIEDGETTTGNKSGIVMNFNGEWVSAGILEHGFYTSTNYANAHQKYKNYGSFYNYVSRNGDAMLETKGWHNSSFNSSNNDNRAGAFRAINGIFSYNILGGDDWGHLYGTHCALSNHSRAVIVMGEGF